MPLAGRVGSEHLQAGSVGRATLPEFVSAWDPLRAVR